MKNVDCISELKAEMLEAMRTLAQDGFPIMTGEGGAVEFEEFVCDNNFDKFDKSISLQDAARYAQEVFLENEEELNNLYQ